MKINKSKFERNIKMENTTLKKLYEYLEFLEKAAYWFSQKWNVLVEAY